MGLLPNNSGLKHGDLRLCNLTQNSLNGMTIRGLTGFMNTTVGGGTTGGYTYDELYLLGEDVSTAFTNGVPSLFAQQHLFNGTCP